jgi:hypothetical protein
MLQVWQLDAVLLMACCAVSVQHGPHMALSGAAALSAAAAAAAAAAAKASQPA